MLNDEQSLAVLRAEHEVLEEFLGWAYEAAENGDSVFYLNGVIDMTNKLLNGEEDED